MYILLTIDVYYTHNSSCCCSLSAHSSGSDGRAGFGEGTDQQSIRAPDAIRPQVSILSLCYCAIVLRSYVCADVKSLRNVFRKV